MASLEAINGVLSERLHLHRLLTVRIAQSVERLRAKLAGRVRARQRRNLSLALVLDGGHVALLELRILKQGLVDGYRASGRLHSGGEVAARGGAEAERRVRAARAREAAVIVGWYECSRAVSIS